MTKAQLKHINRLLIIIGLAIGLISAVEFYIFTSSNRFIVSHITLIAIAFAAYFAYALQRRGKYIDDLRSWWNEMCVAKAAILEYCDIAQHIKSPEKEKIYASSFYKMSASMDKLRLIFCNIDRFKNNNKGYYPFEQIRDMIDLARYIDPQNNRNEFEISKAKRAIDSVFTSLRHSIQKEADLVPPDHPFLFENPARNDYISEIKSRVGLNISEIRESNKIRSG